MSSLCANLPTTVSQLQGWWQQRAGRERAMLLLMLLAISAFLAWYALLAPLLRWQHQAGQQVADAHWQQQQLHTSIEQLQRQDPAALAQHWQDSLQAAGLRLAAQQQQDGQPLVVETAPARASQLLPWLSQLPEPQYPDRLLLWRGNGALHARLERHDGRQTLPAGSQN